MFPMRCHGTIRGGSAAYAAAKSADPSVTVITAGLSPTGVTNGHSADDVQYLQWLYDAGLKGHYDVLGAHPGSNNNSADQHLPDNPGAGHCPDSILLVHPELEGTCWNTDNSFYFRRVEDLRAMGDVAKAVALREK